MHVAQVLYTYPKDNPSLESYLSDIYTLPKIAEKLTQKGIQVTIFMRFWYDDIKHINGVCYILKKDQLPSQLRRIQVPKQLHNVVYTFKPDIVWVHNLRQVFRINHLCKTFSGIPVLVQNHGETPLIKWKRLMKYQLKKVSAVSFTLKDQSQDWFNLGILSPNCMNFEILEGSSPYQNTQITGRNNRRDGQPVFIWTGNLDQNKDPLTILKAFNQLLDEQPNAKLYMAYRYTNLLSQVEHFIEEHPKLQNSVKLLGKLCKCDMESFYNSAHYFIQGSSNEASGYSLIEALSCGTVPIVTKIPSFLKILGSLGYTFNVGQTDHLLGQMRLAIHEDWQQHSKACIKHYQKELSYNRIAEDLKVAFSSLLN